MMNLLIFSLIISLSIQNIKAWTVSCDDMGACNVQMNDLSSGVYIVPGYLPSVPLKNIVPKVSTTSYSDTVWEIGQKAMGYSLHGYLPSSKQYECAGGLDECVDACCTAGICKDPIDQCVMYSNTIRIIYLIVGLVFFLIFLLYWITFYIFGLLHKSQPKVCKSDNIYIKFAPPKILIDDKQEDNEEDLKGNLKEGVNFAPNSANINGIENNQPSSHRVFNDEKQHNIADHKVSSNNHEDLRVTPNNKLDAIMEESYNPSIDTESKKKLGESILNRKKDKLDSNSNYNKYNEIEGKLIVESEIYEDPDKNSSIKNIQKVINQQNTNNDFKTNEEINLLK